MNIKKIVKHFYIFLVLTGVLSLSNCFADWRTDANNRIEQIRKGNFRITAVSQSGNSRPIRGVEVKISQIKHDFGFGSCINYNVTNPDYTDFFKKHFEWAVMENESKWYSNEPNQGSVTYEIADKIYNWCAANGITMRGHCIFWEKEKYAQQWLKDLTFAPLPAESPLRTAVENRMNSAVNHFKGKFVHWDVDNEILAGSFYKDRLGEEIWSWMFQEAHRIDPNCKLFVNEYDVLSKKRYDTTRYENFVTKLLCNGLPVRGIGIQCHIEPNFSRIDVMKVLDNMGKFSLPIWITEFDVQQPDPNLRADDLEDFYRIAFSQPAVGGIMMWGFWQGSHWKENCAIVNKDWTLNEAGKRYESLIKEWTTNSSSATDDKGNAKFRGFYGKYNVILSSAAVKPLTVTIDVVPGGPNEFTFKLPDDSNNNANLLINPGFENGKTGWAGRNCSIAVDSNEKHSGLQSAKAFGRNDTWQGIKQSLIGKMENGKTYRISAWVKLENSDSNNIQLTIAQSDNIDTNYIHVAAGIGSNSNWVQLSGDFTLNYIGALGTLDVYFEGPAAGVNFYVDDVNVFGPPAAPLKPLDANAVGKIDAGIRYQNFEGFGAAGGYDPNWLTAHPKKEELYKLMFKDLGLDIYRIQNLYGINSAYIDNTAEIINGANKVLPEPIKIMIASWSPPLALKSTNHTTGGTLKKDADGKYVYDEFATWWTDSLSDLANRGINIDYMSIQNECDIVTPYASCKFSPAEDVNWAGYNLAFEAVYKKLYSRMGDKMPKMLAPETMGFGRSRPYIDAIIDTNHVYAWTHHLYSDGSGGYDNPEGYVAALRKYAARYAGKPFFQTEYSRNPDFNDAIFTARHIHNSLNYENAASYCYWSLFRRGNIGGGLVTLAAPIGSEGFKINPTYYAFKQFSAFINAGWQRIEASTNSPALRITAFISPDSNRMSIVITNTSADTDIALALSTDNFKINAGKIYRTSRTENCIPAGDFNKDKTVILPKNSITTLALSGEKNMTDKSQAYLNQMRTMLPKNEPWDKWLQTSGRLPPDFDKMPSQPDLPQIPKIQNIEQWQNLRKEYLAMYHNYVFGSVPDAPNNLQAKILNTKEVNNLTFENVLLSFGPENKAKLNIEIIKPAGNGPFPVLLTQPFHKRWAMAAVARGYVACIYDGDDFKDDTKNYTDIWPSCDWSTLTRRAFAAARGVDYLYTLDFVNRNKIAIIGHSRNGKQTLIAGAMDERITAIIPVSSGQGGACPSRFYNESYFGESIEMITRSFPDWFCNTFRFFSGRENKLPVESNILLALMAPRPCLICEAANDGCSSIWGVYQSYFSAKEVYKSLGCPDKIAVALRSGGHGVPPEFIGQTLDWLDWQFGRLDNEKLEKVKLTYQNTKPPIPQISVNNKIDISKYASKGIDNLESEPNRWQQQKTEITKQVNYILGTASGTGVNDSIKEHINQTWQFTNQTVGRDKFTKDSNYAGIEKIDFVIEGYIPAHIYKPIGNAKKYPAVIWLPPACVPFGYSSYYFYGKPIHLELAKRGFAVLAFDPIGFGSRQIEAVDFYNRDKNFSLLGKMVFDARQAIDSLSDVNYIDSKQIYLLGYALGSQVGLYTAALDNRVAGVVCVAGLSPMRLESPDTGGIEKYCSRYPFIPNLQSFIANQACIPYDIHQLIASVAPRKALIVACSNDYETNIEGLKKCIENAAEVYNLYGSRDNLQFNVENNYNYFSIQIQNLVYDWFENNVK